MKDCFIQPVHCKHCLIEPNAVKEKTLIAS